MIRTRTKIEAVLAVAFLLAISISSVFAVTRTISDTSDTVDTYIRNSNGKYWAATGANLQLAINDIPAIGGIVWVGSDITLTTAIRMKNYTIVDFQSHRVTLGSDVSFINLTGGNWYNAVRNAHVFVYNGQTKDVISLYIKPNGKWVDRVRFNLFENINIINSYGTKHNFTGIHMYIDVGADSPADLASFLENTFRKITMNSVKVGILLECDNCDAWGNGNLFDEIWIDDGYVAGVEFRVDAGATNGFNENLFNNIKLQTDTWSKDGFKNINGNCNRFDHCLVWDWYAAISPNYDWSIATTAIGTYISSHYMTYSSINDLGAYTTISSGNSGNLYDRSPYEYIVYENATTVFLQNGSTGLIVDTEPLDNAHQLFYNIIYTGQPVTIFVKKGTYTIHGAIGSSLAHDVTIIGEDKYNTIFQCKASTTLASGIFNSDKNRNYTFKNIKLDGNYRNAGLARGIYLADDNYANNITIDNCVFYDFSFDWQCAIFASAPAAAILKNIKITNNEFINCIDAIYAEDAAQSYWDISNNHFTGCIDNIVLEYVNRSTISNNRIESGTRGLVLDKSCNNTIIGNIIISTTGIIEQNAPVDFNIICLNDCRGCTTPIDKTGVSSVVEHNLGTVS